MNLLTRIIERAKTEKSAIYDLHPDLQHRLPIMRVLSGEEQGMGGGMGTFPGNTQFYQSQVWVHKAIKVIKDNIAPLVLRVVTDNDGDVEVIENHGLTPILQSPNPEMDSSGLWSEWITDMMLGGEWGLEIVKNQGAGLFGIYPRQPHHFSVVPVKEGRRYRQVAEYKIDDGIADPYMLPPEEFIHFKFYNPSNPWRGLAPIMAVRMGVIIDQLAQAWTRLFFRNQARPDYALIAPLGMTRTERDEHMNQLMTDHSTAEGLHRPIILEHGVTDIKTFSHAPKDVEWLEQRKLSRDEVGAIFGVPDEIMGYGRDTYENFDTADRVLWTLTISPLVRFRDETFTHWARRHGLLQPTEQIKTDLSKIPQLQEDRTAKLEQFDKLAGRGYPVNELNEYFELGLPDAPGGDVGYIPFSMVPMTEVGNSDSEPVELALDARNKAAIPEYGSASHETLWKSRQRRLNKPIDQMKRGLKKYFQQQQNEVMRLLRQSRTYGRGKFVKVDERIPAPDELFDYAKWVATFENTFHPQLLAAVQLVGDAEMTLLGLVEAFNIERPEVVRGVQHVLNTVARKTNDTTWEGLTILFQEAELNGEGIPAIQERLSAFFGDRKSDWQTERIARTTMTGAGNLGSQEAWVQSEVVSEKTWISALLPDRTRDAHAAAHGQTVPLNSLFDVGGEKLQYPGDPEGAPGNIINCLCVHVAKVE
jgi:HK97 family phage portal protein